MFEPVMIALDKCLEQWQGHFTAMEDIAKQPQMWVRKSLAPSLNMKCLSLRHAELPPKCAFKHRLLVANNVQPDLAL